MCSRVYARVQRAVWANSNKLNRKARTDTPQTRCEQVQNIWHGQLQLVRNQISKRKDCKLHRLRKLRNLLLFSMNEGDHTQQSTWTYLDLDKHVINSHSTYTVLLNNITWPYYTWQGAQQCFFWATRYAYTANLPMQPNKEHLEGRISVCLARLTG